MSLGQLATEEAPNEITAIPELIDNIDVSGAIVTIDAAGFQKTIAAKIVDNNSSNPGAAPHRTRNSFGHRQRHRK